MQQLKIILFITVFSFLQSLHAQSLLDELEEIAPQETTDYTIATFKSTRIINGQSIENIAVKELNFIIQHRFGPVSNGAVDLFGLDQAQIRFGFAYGLTDRITLGLGRSSFQKTYDGYLKVKVLRQSTGMKNMPITLSYFGSAVINGLPWPDPNRENFFSSRMAYVHQILIARKFNSDFSFQVMPGIVHKNFVQTAAEPNLIPSIGAGFRYKLTNRLSINGEYFGPLNATTRQNNFDCFALGVDIETGGHVFQLHITNATGMFDRNFITETQGDLSQGDILFGFNINRVFNLERDRKK